MDDELIVQAARKLARRAGETWVGMPQSRRDHYMADALAVHEAVYAPLLARLRAALNDSR